MRKKEENNRLRQLIADMKANGILYLKTALAAKELKEFDKNVIIEYDKEERTYIARYK